MPKRFSYTDAVKLLEGDHGVAVKFFDRLASAGLLAGSAMGAGALLSLFDPKADIVAHLRDALPRVRQILGARKSRPGDRIEIITAAHSTVVISAYFDVLKHLDLSVDIESLNLNVREVGGLIGASPDRLDQFNDAIAMLTATPIPSPSPVVPYEKVRESLLGFYRQLSDRLATFLKGLHVADIMSETDLMRLTNALTSRVPVMAQQVYDDYFRRLAVESTEFFVWAGLYDHQATRTTVAQLGDDTAARLHEVYSRLDDLTTGLAGLERVLTLANIGSASFARSALAIKGRAELDWPMVERETLNANFGLTFPRAYDGYINPSCRIVEASENATEFEMDTWWSSIPLREEIQFCLASVVDITDRPVVVLGHPGAGKSLLTRVLAARLCGLGFLAVRVELRRVSPDAPVQRQIEEGIYRDTGERTTWPDLVRSTEDAPRVVLLDGLDELVQVTRVSKSDYLELVQEFQQREAALGRATTVIVTSRTVVAGRTRFPHGSIVIRIEPFSDRHIDLWVGIWNQLNGEYFSRRRLDPLSTEAVLRQEELARQPLLLLMLAIYDAEDNVLQRGTSSLNRAQLYERLLQRFARREVVSRDSGGNLLELQLVHAVEYELLRLAIAAIAMFNRGRQWVSVEELNSDLRELLPGRAPATPIADTRQFAAAVTEAEITVGRFFFVHESRTATDQSYEFLHPTFGEYLVARFVVRTLAEMATQREFAQNNLLMPSATADDDGLLYSLLSFSCLTARGPVLSSLFQIIAVLENSSRQSIRSLCLEIFHRALSNRSNRSCQGYAPELITTVKQMATYSANLLLLSTLFSEGPVTSFELAPDGNMPIEDWQGYANLWRSQLPPSTVWMSFVNALTVTPFFDEFERRGVRIHARDDDGSEGEIPPVDLAWHHDAIDSHTRDDEDEELAKEPAGLTENRAHAASHKLKTLISLHGGWDYDFSSTLFCADEFTATLLDLAYAAMRDDESDLLDIYTDQSRTRLVSKAGTLLRVLAVRADAVEADLEEAYTLCVTPVRHEEHEDSRYLDCVLRLLERDASRLSIAFFDRWIRTAIDNTESTWLIDRLMTLADAVYPFSKRRQLAELHGYATEVREGIERTEAAQEH